MNENLRIEDSSLSSNEFLKYLDAPHYSKTAILIRDDKSGRPSEKWVDVKVYPNGCVSVFTPSDYPELGRYINIPHQDVTGMLQALEEAKHRGQTIHYYTEGDEQ